MRYFVRDRCFEPVRVPRGFSLLVGYSGRPGATREMVARVAARRDAKPEEVEERFGSIAALVETARAALGSGDLWGLGACLTQNHALLRGLGVSTRALDAMVDLALQEGALGAKLTGSGGGGCAIALAPDRLEAVQAAWAAAGFPTFRTEVFASP